jgi:hypothetical protein
MKHDKRRKQKMNTLKKADESTKSRSVLDNKSVVVNLELEKAKKEGANMLLPTTRIGGVSAFHAPVVDYVKLSPDIADGDAYKHDENKFIITKQGLMKLSVCAGIIWNMAETKRVDNRGDRNYVAFQAVGGIRKLDGEPVFFKSEYDLDFEVLEEELTRQFELKAKNMRNKSDEDKRQYVDYCVKRDLLFKRRHKVKLAESGALLRVIRSLLGLKSTYSRKELEKPFVLLRITFKPDFNDPQIRKAMIQKSIESITGIYGGGHDDSDEMSLALASSPPIEISAENDHEDNPDVIDVEPESNTGEQSEPVKEEPEEPKQTHQKADFMAADKDGQISTLQTLAKRKDYDLKQLKRPLDQFTNDQRQGFFDKLMEMPDSDIPF